MSAGSVRWSAAMASGLLRSTPITTRLAPSARIMIRAPSCTRSGYSAMMRWSVVRYGSHSAPLRMIVSTARSLGGASLTCVGNAAPPSPTTPPSCTARTISSGVSRSHCGTMRGRCTCADQRSTAMRTAVSMLPSGCGHSSTSTTVPDALACTGAETKPSAVASVSPRST